MSRWNKSPKHYLDDVSLMLCHLGIGLQAQRRIPNPDRLYAYLRTSSGRRYDIKFLIEGEELLFESIVMRAVSGEPTKALVFYQALLAYKFSMPKIGYGLLVSNENWLIGLGGGQDYRSVDGRFLYDLVQYYDLAYSEHVPEIERLAEELGLQQTGLLDKAIKQFLDAIMD